MDLRPSGRVRGFVGVVGVLAVAVAVTAVAIASGPPGNSSAIAVLVRHAILLERDAQGHLEKDPKAARKELSAASAVLGQALALGPPAAAASDLKQARLKDEDASALVGTVNKAKVRLDLAGALNAKEAALTALGVPVAGPALAGSPPAPPPPAPKKKLSPAELRTLLKSALEWEYKVEDSLDTPVDPRVAIQQLQKSIAELQEVKLSISKVDWLFDLRQAQEEDREAIKELERGASGETVDDALGSATLLKAVVLDALPSGPSRCPEARTGCSYTFQFSGLHLAWVDNTQNVNGTIAISGQACGATPLAAVWTITRTDIDTSTVQVDFSQQNPAMNVATNSVAVNGTTTSTISADLTLVTGPPATMTLTTRVAGPDATTATADSPTATITRTPLPAGQACPG